MQNKRVLEGAEKQVDSTKQKYLKSVADIQKQHEEYVEMTYELERVQTLAVQKI
jgi:hypothetical protein